MRTGELRHVVTIESLSSTTANSYGEHVETWTTVTTRRAKIEQLTVSEGDGVSQSRAEAGLRVTMRYYSGLSPKTNRIVWQGRTFGIVGVEHTNIHEQFTMNSGATVAVVREVV